MRGGRGVTDFTSPHPNIELLPEPVWEKGNYAIIGRCPTYSLPLNNKFVDSETYALMRKYTTGDYHLADVQSKEQAVASHRKYQNCFDTRDNALLDKYQDDPVFFDLLWSIWGEALTADRPDTTQVVAFQQMAKGSGNGCSGTKGTCFAQNPLKCYEAIENQPSYYGEVPIDQSVQKLEVRLKTKNTRCYVVFPMWYTMQVQSFTKLQNLRVQEFKFKTPSAVGISMPLGWIAIEARLTKYRVPGGIFKLGNWDIELFDSTQAHQLMEVVRRLRAKGLRLSKRELREFNHLSYHKVNRIVLMPDGSLHWVMDGNGSGHPDTTTDNGINHVSMFAICWREIYGSFAGFKDFLETSGLLVFGDDGICALVNQQAVDFFSRLPATWKRIFGANLKLEIHDEWKDAHFLGQQPLGNNYPYSVLAKPHDVDREITNLVLKGQRENTFDPVKELQRGIAHRALNAFTYLYREHQLIDDLVDCMRNLIEDWDERMTGSVEWTHAKRYALMSHEDFANHLVSSMSGPVFNDFEDEAQSADN